MVHGDSSSVEARAVQTFTQLLYVSRIGIDREDAKVCLPRQLKRQVTIPAAKVHTETFRELQIA